MKMNSVQEWDDVLQHFDLEDFLEILFKVVSQFSPCSYPHQLLILVEGWVTRFFCATPGVGRSKFVK